MVGHHFLTLALLGLAHAFNVQRMGFLILALLNFSSPFMHAAKIMHYGGAPGGAKAGTFILFAAAFALSRCVLFPRLLWTIVGAIRERLARGQTEVVLPATILMSGLVLLQALQFYWMRRIVRCGGSSACMCAMHAPPAAVCFGILLAQYPGGRWSIGQGQIDHILHACIPVPAAS